LRVTKSLLTASLLCGFALAQGGRPDVSGSWKLNTDKSKLNGPAGRVLVEVIEQKGLNIKVTTQGGATGDSQLFEGAFQANGKPRIERLDGGHYRFTKVTWETGTTATLVFEITEKDGKKDLSKILKGLRESWTLSPNGKVLTKFRRIAVAGKIEDEKYVFDKQ
jgi:hypothetical protein